MDVSNKLSPLEGRRAPEPPTLWRWTTGVRCSVPTVLSRARVVSWPPLWCRGRKELHMP